MKSKNKYIIFIMILCSIILPFDVSASETQQKPMSVILGGEPFGIKMFCDGVIVVKTENSYSENILSNVKIQTKDIIVTANGKYISSSEELTEIVNNSKGEEVTLKIKRDNEYFNINALPKMDENGIYRLGLWVKDSAAGLGTVTFYNTEESCFCGLGHGICEIDTGIIMPLAEGDVDKAYISSITKSSDGNIGSLNGYFTNDDIGYATNNLNEGIYGVSETALSGRTVIEVAEAEDVTIGKAQLYTTIKGDTPQAYDIEIIKIDFTDETKNMIVRITDEKLLDITGGIVQGMSGSPIVKDGKIAGALTHVMVEQADTGYAIFAETMFEITENL